MSLRSRLSKRLINYLDAAGGRPSVMGRFAKTYKLGTRLDQLARLGLATDDTGDGATVGADLVRVPPTSGPDFTMTKGIVTWLTNLNESLDAATYDPTAIAADGFDRANHTGTQPATTGTYDNATSGLTATTVQAALDELAAL